MSVYNAKQLANLAARIDAEHAAIATALQSVLGHAICAGEMLIEVKRHVRRNKCRWLPWLEANSAVPSRTASHYMRLAKHRAKFCDENGNVVADLSVRRALDLLKHHADRGGINGSEPSVSCVTWGGLSWGTPFANTLQGVTRLTQSNPPAPRYIVKAALAGKAPGLTAPALREAIALLTRYAEALEAKEQSTADGLPCDKSAL